MLFASGTIGVLRLKPPAVTVPAIVTRRPTAGFCKWPAASAQPGGRDDMEAKSQQEEKPAKTTGDTMSHSFGEGYATRSDEEGFGGVYGGNQAFKKPDELADHPEYDKSQGSEVKEKEKARNQPHASN